MSATRGRRSPSPLVLLAAVVPGLLVGCTICPSPYDYAGPVPNGSAPQSDFRARSGGILPIGTTPRPWPTLVQGAEADAAGAIEGPDAIDDTVLTTAAVDPAVTDAAPTAVPAAERTAGDDSVPPTGPAEPAPVTAAPDAAPALAETPGWRPRRAADEGR